MKHRLPLFALGIASLLSACAPAPEAPESPAPAVRTAPVETRDVELLLPLTGRVEPLNSLRLRALVDGRVMQITVADGAQVSEGETVLTLGGPRLEAQKKSLKAAVRAAEIEVESAEDLLKQAERRTAKHLATPGEFARARTDVAAAEARLEKARNARKRFEDSLMLHTPISGRFTGRRVSTGQEILAGEELATILNPKGMRIAAEVIPRPGLDVAVGQDARVEAGGAGTLAAEVQAILPSGGTAGEISVWLSGEALADLSPGMVVRGSIVAAVHEAAVIVPPGALVMDREDEPLVFVGEDPPYEPRPVIIGERKPDAVEILSGLQVGEHLVVEGAYELYWAEFSKNFKVED